MAREVELGEEWAPVGPSQSASRATIILQGSMVVMASDVAGRRGELPPTADIPPAPSRDRRPETSAQPEASVIGEVYYDSDEEFGPDAYHSFDFLARPLPATA